MIILEILTVALVVVATYVVLCAFYHICNTYYNQCIKIEMSKSDNINLKAIVNRKRIVRCRFTTGAYALTAFWIVVLLTITQHSTK